MKRIIVYLSFLVVGIIFSGCSNLNQLSDPDTQNYLSGASNFQNGTFERAPFSDEWTGDEGSSGTTLTTSQDLGNGDKANIHRLLLTSGTTLVYSGFNNSGSSPAYREIFKNQSGHTFVYSETDMNPRIAIKIYNKYILPNIPEDIFSGLCVLYDQSGEMGIPKGTKFGYKPSSKYQEQIDIYRKDQNTIIDSEISKTMETNALDMMSPCGFLNTFQVIGDYIVAGKFGRKDGQGLRGGRLNTIEIIKQ